MKHSPRQCLRIYVLVKRDNILDALTDFIESFCSKGNKYFLIQPVFIFYCCTTNYHKFSELKKTQDTIILPFPQVRKPTWQGLVLCSGCHKAKMKAEFSPRGFVKTVSNLTHAIGGMEVLAICRIAIRGFLLAINWIFL